MTSQVVYVTSSLWASVAPSVKVIMRSAVTSGDCAGVTSESMIEMRVEGTGSQSMLEGEKGKESACPGCPGQGRCDVWVRSDRCGRSSEEQRPK